MYRSYRMRYGEEPIIDGYTPIQIIVRMMSGFPHTLFSENDNENFLAVKTALLPHIDNFHISQLVFQIGNSEIGYTVVDDSATVSSLATDRVIILDLIIRERVWTQEEKDIINDMRCERFVNIYPLDFNTPDKIDAAIHGLNIRQNNQLSHLQIIGMSPTVIMSILNVFRGKTNMTGGLAISNGGMNPDEMAEVFDIISEIPHLRSLTIENRNDSRRFRRNVSTYRMNDLAEFLRKKSPMPVEIFDTDVEIGGDYLYGLATILLGTTNQSLSLYNNRIISDGDINRQALIDSLELITLFNLDILDNEIKKLQYENGTRPKNPQARIIYVARADGL